MKEVRTCYTKIHLLEQQQVHDISLTPFYVKGGHKISHERGTLPVSGREEHSYHQRLGVNVEIDLYKHTY